MCLGVKVKRLIWLLINLPVLWHQNVLLSQQPGPNPFLSECNWCHSNFSPKGLRFGVHQMRGCSSLWAHTSVAVLAWGCVDGYEKAKSMFTRWYQRGIGVALPTAACREITLSHGRAHTLILFWQWFLAQLNLNLISIQGVTANRGFWWGTGGMTVPVGMVTDQDYHNSVLRLLGLNTTSHSWWQIEHIDYEIIAHHASSLQSDMTALIVRTYTELS